MTRLRNLVINIDNPSDHKLGCIAMVLRKAPTVTKLLTKTLLNHQLLRVIDPDTLFYSVNSQPSWHHFIVH